MWKVKNTGNVEWPIGSHLLFNGGSILRPYPISHPDCFAVPVIGPDEETCITAELQAPDSPGDYTSYFCLCTPEGQRFGDNLWCTIKVDEDLEPEKKPHDTTPSAMINSSEMIYPTPSTTTSASDQHHHEDALSESTAERTSLTDSQISSDDDRDTFADEEYSDHNSTDAYSFTNQLDDDDFVLIENNSEDTISSSVHSNNTVTPKSPHTPSIQDSLVYQSELTQLHEMVIIFNDKRD